MGRHLRALVKVMDRRGPAGSVAIALCVAASTLTAERPSFEVQQEHQAGDALGEGVDRAAAAFTQN